MRFRSHAPTHGRQSRRHQLRQRLAHFFSDLSTDRRHESLPPTVVTKYQKRISGPILDSIDIHIEVSRVDHEKLSGNQVSESSKSIRTRVQVAREIQNKRFANGKATDIVCNADMRIVEIRKFCQLQDEGQSLMRAAMSQLRLSARAYHRILKLAQTIADIAGSEDIQSTHLAEALQYRPKLMVG